MLAAVCIERKRRRLHAMFIRMFTRQTRVLESPYF
jgi:hypothetical protein